MSKRCYYEVLEITKTSSDQEIKKSYRKMAMRFHPDRNPGDKGAEDKFKEAAEAYEMLSDAQKRQAYDQFGHAGVDASAGQGGFGGGGFSDVGDIFGDIFGGGARHRGPQPGQDLQYEVTLTLEEAVAGKTVDLRIPTKEVCDVCEGLGAEEGFSAETCPTCQGSGQVRIQQGFFAVARTCPTCHGNGKIIKSPCKLCRGEGYKHSKKTLSVKIPAGVDNGNRIRVQGEGEAGEVGAPHGDLFVMIRVKEHQIFKRDDNTLYCELPLSFPVAALGGTLNVPNLNGKSVLKIPAGTQSGQRFKMSGKGVKSVRSSRVGDMIVQVQIETPIKLTKDQKELLAKFRDSLTGKHHKQHSPKESGFFDSVKSFLINDGNDKNNPWK